MEQRPLEYTVKIYCEGFTEWYYFEWLRTNNRFKFSMEPDIPKNSRSSYKQNLKLIDKELRKNPQERAMRYFSSSTPIPWSRTKRNTPFIKKQRRNTRGKE